MTPTTVKTPATAPLLSKKLGKSSHMRYSCEGCGRRAKVRCSADQLTRAQLDRCASSVEAETDAAQVRCSPFRAACILRCQRICGSRNRPIDGLGDFYNHSRRRGLVNKRSRSCLSSRSRRSRRW